MIKMWGRNTSSNVQKAMWAVGELKLPCERVASIDSFTWKCSVAADQIGIHREHTKHPAKVTVPDDASDAAKLLALMGRNPS